MTQAPAQEEKYLDDFRALAERPGANGPGWLQDVRERALARFAETGFPTTRRGNEKWKYTNVGPIARTTFGYPAEARLNGLTQADIRRKAPWHRSWTTLVFVDGRYAPGLSAPPRANNGVHVGSLAEALETHEEVVQRHLVNQASVEDDAFAALNTAFLHDGAFIHVPEGRRLRSPMHLVFVSTGRPEPTVSHPRILLVAGPRSKATIIESYVGLESARYFTNSVSEMVLGEGAEVDHYRLLTESDDSFHVGVAKVHQAEGSVFESSTFEKSVGLGRYDLNVLLDGPETLCRLNGLYVTSGTQHVDNLINIDHAKPYSTSRLYYKGILDGKSRAVFGGTVWVREGAIKADALQSDKNLVLSPDAEVDSKPALFIFADDVKCGHGATAGNIDLDTVFYMRGRGIDLETASRLLIYGFAGDIIDKVKVGHLRAYLERLFLRSLPAYRFEF